MHITTNAQLLAHEVRLLNGVASEKTPLPILSNILFVATDRLMLAATDLQVSLRTPCKATIIEQGSITLPAKKLLEILDQLPTADVTILVEKGHALITCESFRSRLQTFAARDFPSIPEVEGDIATLPSSALKTLLERTRYAVSDKSGQYVLKGALLSVFGDVFAMVSTDGRRLSVATATCPVGANVAAVLPLKTMEVLASFCDGKNLEFCCSNNNIFFVSGQRILIGRMLEGQFPKYERIIPKDCDKKITVNRVALIAALRRVGTVSEEVNNGVSFQFKTNTIHLTSRSAEIGDADETLTVNYDGPDYQAMLNGKHVLDFLEKSAQPGITIDLKNDNTPLLFTDGPDFINVIMGMR